MAEQLDVFGGATLTGPPPVPAVTFHPRPARHPIMVKTRTQCAHCVMNAARWHRDPGSIPQWAKSDQVIILTARHVITQTDGSTLFLCDQHADEHEQRGTADV